MFAESDAEGQLLTGTEEAWKDALVCTVGSVSVWPGSNNVIAGSANFTVDIRCGSNVRRQSIVADVTSAIKGLCIRSGFYTSTSVPNTCL